LSTSWYFSEYIFQTRFVPGFVRENLAYITRMFCRNTGDKSLKTALNPLHI